MYFVVTSVRNAGLRRSNPGHPAATLTDDQEPANRSRGFTVCRFGEDEVGDFDRLGV